MPTNPKYSEARYSIISMRVTQDEMDKLDKICGKDKTRMDVLYPLFQRFLQTSGKSEPVC